MKDVTGSSEIQAAETIGSRPRLSRRAIVGFVVTTALSASLLLLLFARLISASQSVGDSGASPIVGHAAPDFTITLLNAQTGQKLHLADLKGRPVVLNFWASWCVPCQDEAPILEAGAKQYAGQGVVFVGVAYEDVASDSVQFLQQHNITYLVGPDKSGAIAISYGVPSVPETVFINRQGIVVDKFGGALSQNMLDQRVAKILA
jgi:cytochrome c biogenesis protein CcmG, thiol:disulfide interchange protein DsbE